LVTLVNATYTVNSGSPSNATYALVNWTDAALTIVQGAGLSMYLAGAATTVGNRTLAPRGWATIWFQSGSIAYIMGNVS
jgi:hypothetical protein